MKKILSTIAAFALVATIASCGGNNQGNNNAGKADSTSCNNKQECNNQKDCNNKQEDCCADKKTETAATVDLSKKYVCPNRDGSSDQPGECENCGMEYIENK